MKAIAVVAAAASLLALAGCAGMQTKPAAIASATSTAKSGTYYCWQDRLDDLGPDLICNWEHSLSDACSAKDLVSLPKANVADVRKKTHRCENGQWLVTVKAR